MSPAVPRAERIALLNELVRLRTPMPRGRYGCTVCTQGVAALSDDEQDVLFRRIRSFTDFTEDNDPYGERDFGAVSCDGGGKVFWKIDYYADASCATGSEDPADPEKCYRILTIMLAEEY